MGEKTTTCPGCNRTMLQSTADEHNGFCLPCSRDPAIAMPEDFRLDEDIAARLRAAGEDPNSEYYRGILWQSGRDRLCSQIDYEEELARQTKERLPRLIALIESRRRLNRHPKRGANPTDGLSDGERGILAVVKEMFNEDIWKSSGVSLLIVPLAALPVGEAARDAHFPHSIVLTQDEWKEWLDMCPDHYDSTNWCTYSYDVHTNKKAYKKTLSIGVEAGRISEERLREDLNTDEKPWIATFDFRGGWTFGNGYTSLWGWNGKQPRLVKSLGCYIT